MDLSTHQPRIVQAQRRKHNIEIKENHGLDKATGFWWLCFTFDYALEKNIEVRLTNYKYSDRRDWTLEVIKCHYLGIESKENMASFDMVDDFVNSAELSRLNGSASSKENLYHYLETNIVPIITRKIKYTKYKPQFRFFLSHKTRDKPFMRTFENGLRFLGYDTWLDVVNMPMGASLQGALKTSIDDSDCLIAWLNGEYLQSEYCTAELLYAKKQGKIIIPFGVYSDIKEYITGEIGFLRQQVVFDPTTLSFFEVLRRIDETLFDFEKLPQ